MNSKLPITLYIGLVFWIGILVVFVPRILAAEGDILLFDDFNDKKLDGWTIESGNWYVNPQKNLAGSYSGTMHRGQINTGSSEWDNYRIEANINGFQGIDESIGVRYSPSNSYQIHLRYNPGTGQYNTPEIKLEKYVNNELIILFDTHSYPLTNNVWYRAKVELLNDNIKFWINDTLIFDFTDTNTNIKKGTVSLSYWSGDTGVAYMKFDNVKVTALAPPPLPRLPVIFIPGIGGSEFKASEDIYWADQDDGHGGKYSHAYRKDEKIWVNQDEAVKLGDDDYFDVLRLKTDGETSEANLSLTGNFTTFGYTDIDSFFTQMGYVKNTNFFIFPYDWRKDIRNTKDALDTLIETAKQQSGQSKVNLVVHSMGGLVARYYISDPEKATKVNKLIELGVPHLGAVESLKTLMYGSWLGYDFGLLKIGIPPSQTKDTSQNFPSIFKLLPSLKYFDFYDDYFPFKDDRDIDNNKVTGSLTFDQTKTLLSNLNYNMGIFNLAEQFHNNLDPNFNQTNGVTIYGIIGTSQPTLGQIHETWWITWPINLISKTDEIFINGDGTVPLYSASLKNDLQDLSGASKLYYVKQKHGDLVSSNSPAMLTVKAILDDDNSLPVEASEQKTDLEGEQLTLDDGELDLYDDQNRHCGLNDNGEIEENIPDVTCTTSGKTKHAFVKKKASKVKVKVTRKKPVVNSKTTNLKKRTYQQSKVTKSTVYKDISLNQTGKIEFDLNPSLTISPILIFYPDSNKPANISIEPTSEVRGTIALDQTPPISTIGVSGDKNTTGIYADSAIITLTGSDSGSGILKTEYSLDDGQTVQTYIKPFTISDSGKTTLQFKSIDKVGNEEIPQAVTIEIAAKPTPTPTSTSVSNNSSSSNTNSSTASSTTAEIPTSLSIKPSDNSLTDKTATLGIVFPYPHHISDQIHISNVLGTQKENIPQFKQDPSFQIFEKILAVSGGIITIASVGLGFTFLKPIPK